MTPEQQAAIAALAAANLAASNVATVATTPAATTSTQGQLFSPETLEQIPEHLRDEYKAYVQQLRGENKSRRVSEAEAIKRASDAETELNRIKSEKAETERLEAEKRGDFERLYKEKAGEITQVTAAAHQVLIEAKLENAFLKKGIPTDLLKLVEKSGLSVDGHTVKGVDEAIVKLEAEYGNVIKAMQGVTAGTTTGATTAAATTSTTAAAVHNPADDMMIPGQTVTYKQMNEILAKQSLGATPDHNLATNAGKKELPQFNKPGQKMTKDEKAKMDAWYENQKRNMK